MSIQRIDNFRLESRHLFSGIFGRGVEDTFIDSDLRSYGLWEALYMSLTRQGYTVVFYSQDPRRNFFSFRKRELATLYSLTPREASPAAPATSPARRYVAQVDSPFGRRRRAGGSAPVAPAVPAPEPDYDQIQTCLSGGHTFYRVADSVDPFMTVTNYIENNPQQKIAFIFATAFSDKFTPEQVRNIDSMFDSLKITFNSRGIQARIIMIYSCRSSSRLLDDSHDGFFTNKHFREVFLDSSDSGEGDSGASRTYDLYEMPGPGTDEIRNMLNRRRLLDGLDPFSFAGGVKGAAVRLGQELFRYDRKQAQANPALETLAYYNTMPVPELQQMLTRFDTDHAIDRLRSMCGMDGVVRQLERYVKTLADIRAGIIKSRFRPHLVFSGNPGTGKTTVARLLADILREEGLLERGHLIEATVGDLEGEYVGQTRIKTQALCDRARGGVLFIDEAYGLMSGASRGGENVDYGKEAIEVLIQFMENTSDSLVILGGYRADMENLIQSGNQGFMRRFNGKESFIQFEDYDSDALYAIFRRQIDGMKTLPEFDTAVRSIINFQHAHRNARWGNAGEMEKLASSILIRHNERDASGPLTPDDIPEQFMRLIASVDSIDAILADIDRLAGLGNVKMQLRKLLKSCMGQRRRAMRDTDAAAEKRNLNFIFTGAPGTGKTTVAGLMAKILYSAGIIDKSPEPVVVQKGDIIKSGVGDTPKAIKQLFSDHAGEVIFIDEAYGLAEHGAEAINEITNCLTDRRFMGNQAVILAGYTQEMDEMLRTNRGLRSRFANIWLFEDYTDDELWSVFMGCVASRKMRLADEGLCRTLADEYFGRERARLGMEFSNARKANQLFDLVAENYDIREFEEGVSDLTILPSDFPGYTPGRQSGIDSQSVHAGSPLSAAVPATEPAEASPAPSAPAVYIDLSGDETCRVSEASHYAMAVGLISTSRGMGTGFVASVRDRLVITAFHVVDRADGITFHMERGSVSTPLQVLWTDPLADMAILRADALPDGVRCFAIDHNAAVEPALLEPIIHCGFVKGTSVSTNFLVYEGKVSGYDPQKRINDVCLDAILSDIAAINGCSGGPVMRASDMTVIGILQGGFDGVPTRVISDIHQLHKNSSLTIIK